LGAAIPDRREGGHVIGWQTERAYEKLDDAPDREEDDKTDNSIHGEDAPRLARFLIGGPLNEVLIHTEKKDKKRDGNKHRDENAVDNTENALFVAQKVTCVDASGGHRDFCLINTNKYHPSQELVYRQTIFQFMLFF